MKKALFISAALFIAASVSSCKKNWTCSCTITSAGVQTPYSFVIDNNTQSQANATCNTYQTNYNASGAGFTTASCSI